jgi:preprotein translocase subunit YajC
MLEQLSNFFISNVHADVAGLPTQQGGGMSFIVMLIVFVVFIYFAIWRPQNKRAKEQQTLLVGLTKGDEVMTTGGLLGRIAKISDQYITLTIGNNVDIFLQKSSIVTILPKGTLKSLE